MDKYLIIGLGNIGEEYNLTRHNIGFKIVDKLAKDAEFKFNTSKLADVCNISIKGRKTILIKPSTYMNLSGKAVQYWLQAEKIQLKNCLILVDDIALPFGKLRFAPKGSDGGHNGLKNIQEVLQTSDYNRLRFGIDNKFSRGGLSDYVLGKWNETEQQELDKALTKAAEAVKSYVFRGLEETMNFYNK